MKNYYFILGVSIYARPEDIKTAYRKLAFQFHPDVNPSPEAETKFKEINEAYEVLSNPAAKNVYDQLLTGKEEQVATPVRAHRDPRYRPKAAGTYTKKSKKAEMLEMMARYLPYTSMVSRITFVFAVVLFIDYVLPYKKTERSIIEQKDFGRSRSSELEITQGRKLKISQDKLNGFKAGAIIIVYSSPLLDIPRKVENERSHFVAMINVSIYGNFLFIPFMLLITASLGAFYEKGIEFRFNLGIVNFLLLLLNFLFLQVHKF